MTPTALLEQSWSILRESAVYILLGFFIAALMHVWLSRGRFAEMLRTAGPRSVLMATLVGAPMPLCSCAVLPAAIAMRRRGASKGATLSFLISTPETGVTAILLTYALIGPLMAVIRPIAACVTALTAGLVEDFIEKRWPEPDSGQASAPSQVPSAQGEHEGCAHEHPAAPPTTFADGFRHAFIDIFDDVIGWMLVSFLVAGAINVLLPDLFGIPLLSNPWLAMGVMLVIGVPLFVCAEASTPIAAALMLKGISPGAALVFLLGGPATNFGSIAVIAKQFGRRTVTVYLATIAVVALAMGALLNLLSQRYAIMPASRAMTGPWMPEWLKTTGAIVFLGMAAFSFARLRYGERFRGWLNALLGIRLTPGQGRFAAAALAGLLYAATGFGVVRPDEIGMVKRFGRLAQADAAPGLYFVAPWPIGRLDVIRVREVRREMLGQASAAAGVDEKTAWMWLGDENVANITYVVQWDARPEALRQFAYGVSDARKLVRSAAQAAMRETLSTTTIDSIYTTARSEAEARARDRAQAHCDLAASGIRIEAIRFQSVHAPAEVHETFRDVASALEDRATRIDQAEGERARVIALSRGSAAMKLSDAQGEAASLQAAARGEADAFGDLIQAAAACEDVTRTRLYFEMLDRVMPGARKFLRIGDTRGRALELWLRGEKIEANPAATP